MDEIVLKKISFTSGSGISTLVNVFNLHEVFIFTENTLIRLRCANITKDCGKSLKLVVYYAGEYLELTDKNINSHTFYYLNTFHRPKLDS